MWIKMWNAYLGDSATPEALARVITDRKVKGATGLKREIEMEFEL